MELSTVQKEILRKQVEAELCKRSFYEFFKMAVKVLEPSTPWSFNWHIEYTCNILQEEVERIIRGEKKTKDLIFSLPFRSSKSLIISVCLPSWCLIKDPTLSILNVSATAELATKFSHKAKMLITSNWFEERFGQIFTLRQDSKAKSNFITDKGGGIQAFGITGTIIGSGGDLILIDDPSSPDANNSPSSFTTVINTYLDILYSRLNNPDVGLRVLVQQRLNVNDLTGYLLRTQPDKYRHICIPAELSDDVEPKDLAMFYYDGLFWPERFSRKVLDDFKQVLRGSAYASQLMMRPQLIEGDLIKRSWFPKVKLSDVLNYNIQWNLVCDTAYTSSQKNDPSALMICGTYQNKLYIRKVIQRWLQFYELLEEIKEIQKIYNIRKIYIESKATGLSIQQELKRQTNFNVLPLEPIGDKVARVTSIQPQLESGRVILIEDDTNEAFLNEVAAFPAGRDDQVDVLCYSVQEFMNKSGTTIFR